MDNAHFILFQEDFMLKSMTLSSNGPLAKDLQNSTNNSTFNNDFDNRKGKMVIR
jgi:hypothetical protein